MDDLRPFWLTMPDGTLSVVIGQHHLTVTQLPKMRTARFILWSKDRRHALTSGTLPTTLDAMAAAERAVLRLGPLTRAEEVEGKQTSRRGGSDRSFSPAAIRHALEAAGVESIEEEGGDTGVRLREPAA